MRSTPHSVHYKCLVLNAQCTVHTAQCTVHSAQCTLYSTQCTVHTLHSTVNEEDTWQSTTVHYSQLHCKLGQCSDDNNWESISSYILPLTYTLMTRLCPLHSTLQTTEYTLLHSTEQYRTAEYSTLQHSTTHYRTVQHGTVQNSTAQYRKVQCSAVRHSAVKYSAVELSRR